MPAYLVGGIVTIIGTILYFMDYKRRSQQLFDSRDIMSWLSVGLLVFYSGYLPIKIIRQYALLNNPTEPSYVRTIHYSLIIAMYTLISIGFMRMKRLKLPS
ncbi:MAG: hypothetical protein COA50_11925 [Flavobacteriaceae bacterium]|nr:MAG: hypothetical protein COA50_11925 [Flavobacteriaceae bacterium]